MLAPFDALLTPIQPERSTIELAIEAVETLVQPVRAGAVVPFHAAITPFDLAIAMLHVPLAVLEPPLDPIVVASRPGRR